MAQLAAFYAEGRGAGRPPKGLEWMLRMYVAQQCFGLSDEGIKDALYDSQAIRRLVDVDRAREAAPDATTLLRFRGRLEAHGLTGVIFQTINAQLAPARPTAARGHAGGRHADRGAAVDQEPRPGAGPGMHQAKKGNP